MEGGFKVRLHLFVETVVVPREVLGVVVALQEGGRGEVVESFQLHLCRIAEDAHIEVSVAVNEQVAHVFSDKCELARRLVVYFGSEGLDDLCSHADVVLVVVRVGIVGVG